MRTTLDLDEEVLREAQEYAPPGMTKTALIEEALRAYVQREARRFLTSGRAYQPDFVEPPRRRSV